MKKRCMAIMSVVLLAVGISACGSNSDNNSEDTIVVDFWTAPQVVQFDYWSEKATEFNNANIALNDKTIQVRVQQMPESPSSEAGIQNAIATNTVPAVSENINRGFAKTLADAGVVYDISNEDWFQDIVESRSMEELIKGWELDGGQYVIPVFVNPMIYQWNMPLLREIGIDEPATTVEDLKEIITAYRENEERLQELGIIGTFYRTSLTRPDIWWDRWFDFQMQYVAFTGGKGWVENDELVLDQDATKDVFELFGLFGDTLILSELSTLWTSDVVPFLLSINAPWEIEMMREAGKVYGLDGDYVYWQPIVKNASDDPYTFVDSKGLVFYRNSNITDEMHAAAVEFIKWVYNAENSAQTDLDWLKATNMLPSRGDLVELPEFVSFFEENIELQGLAEFVSYGVPAMASDKMADIQGVFTEYGLAPYIESARQVSDFNVPDATEYVERAFEAMRDVMR